MRIAITVFSVLLLGGCATSEPANTAFYQMEPGSLPATNITLNIPGLTPCTDNPDHSLHLKVSQPVYVLVHGCFGSSGQFRGLAQVLAFHGQQITRSATELRRAIDLLVAQSRAPLAGTGAKWADITYSSRFIREPGALIPQVSKFLKIDTDERGTCRREEGGRCVAEDEIFSLAEQRNSTVETDGRERRVEVRAGHVEIVGDRRAAPTKLIAILQEEGAIPPTGPERLSAFNQLLARIYQDDQGQSAQEKPAATRTHD
jgi:hypothetical protein